MFEGSFSPPVYHELYNFIEGSQDDIFEDSYISLPDPAPNAPLPVLRDITNQGQGQPSTPVGAVKATTTPAGTVKATATPTQSSAVDQTQTIGPSVTTTPFASIHYWYVVISYVIRKLMQGIVNVQHLPEGLGAGSRITTLYKGTVGR